MPQETRIGASVAIVVMRVNAQGHGEVLLGRRKSALAQGLLSVPGGWMDMGELAEDAAIRELEEETGLRYPDTISAPLFYGVTSSLINSGPGTEEKQCQTHYFFCWAKDDAEAKLTEPEKCEGWEWLTLPQIESSEMSAFYPGTKWMLLALFAEVKVEACLEKVAAWQEAARRHEETAIACKDAATRKIHVQP